MPEAEVGAVTHYFDRPHVAIIKLAAGEVAVGDTIHIKGAHTDLTETVTSMEVEHAKIQVAKPGDEVGLQVADRVRTGDRVYKVTP
jgi:translation elongation factor EF-1alpha